MKKKILFGLSIIAVATISVKSTVAYLASETETLVNTMTAGNVEIQHLEYERIVENGNWVVSTEKDQYGYYPDKLQEFTQNKMLVPAVFTDGKIKWDDRNGSEASNGEGSHQQSWAEIGAPGSNQLFDSSVKNVIDKFIFVKNTGNNDAYVRTWIAYEQGDVKAENYYNTVQFNMNIDWWEREKVGTDVVIADENGVESKYVVVCYTFKGEDKNHTGILTPNTITRPSLLQVYMKPQATNEDIKALDGNNNGKYDILVVSQASQVAGYDNAKDSLDAAFGEVSIENHPFYRQSLED